MAIDIPQHGGNIYKAAGKLGFKSGEILDFSANINPFGIPPNLKAHLKSCLDMCTNYPDPESNRLKCQLAAYTGVQRKNICVGNGALDLIYLVFHAANAKKVIIPAPTFNEYEKAARTSGAEVIYYKRPESKNFRIDFDELLSFSIEKGSDTILICNPNNPTSTAEKSDELVSFVKKAAQNNIKVIIDEAFIELTKNMSELSVSSFVKEFSNLYVIRAVTKFFGIPGLRLGYCLSSEANILEIVGKQPSWPINTLASEAGIVFDIDKEYISRTNEWIKNEPDYLYKELGTIEEIKAFPPETNFILCKLISRNWDAERLRELLLKDRILIRNAGNFVFLDDTYFRVAVKDRESNNCLLRSLKNIKWR